jgi:ribonucleotide reductase alpha subunit
MQRSRFLILIFCLWLFMLIGCATTQEKYNDAVGKNSIRELENFLRENPNTPFTNSALKKLEELYFQRAEQNNSIREYENFLRLRAQGHFTPSRRTAKPPPGTDTDEYAIRTKVAIARLKYEEAFARAKRSNSKSSYERFLKA